MYKLTDKQKRFCGEYLKDLNATKAASRAGYSKKTAYSMGQQLLKKIEIKSKIDSLISKREARTEITVDRVVQEIAKIAFSEINSFIDWDEGGIRIKPLANISKKETGCISEISEVITDKYMNLKFKLYDKLKALELLGRHMNMFEEKHSHKHYGDLNLTFTYGTKNLSCQPPESKNRIKGHSN